MLKIQNFKYYPILILVLIASFNHGFSQVSKADRIKIEGIQNVFWTNPSRNSGINLNSEKRLEIILSSDNEITLLLLDSGKLIKNSAITLLDTDITDWAVSSLHVQDITIQDTSIYALIRYSSFQGILKLKKSNLEIQWLKKFNNFRYNDLFVNSSGIYCASQGTNHAIITRISHNGSIISSKRINDVGSAQIDFGVNDGANIAQLVGSENDVTLITIDDASQTPFSELAFFKFSIGLNLIESKSFSPPQPSYFTLNDAYWVNQNNRIGVELSNLGSSRFGSVVFSSSLTFIRSKHFDFNGGLYNPNELVLKNIDIFGTNRINYYSGYQILTDPFFNFLKTGKVFDLVIYENDFFTNLLSLRRLKYTFEESFYHNMDISGFSRLGNKIRQFNYFDFDSVYQNNSVCDSCFLEILEYSSINPIYPCNSFENTTISQTMPQIWQTQGITKGIISESETTTNLAYNNSFNSYNQFQSCGPSFDTCNSLYVEILEDSFSICKGEIAKIHSLTYEAKSYNWVFDTIIGNEQTLHYSFDTVGTFWLKLEIDPGPNLNCKKSDSILVTVNPIPNSVLSDTTICLKDSTQILLNGATSAIWTPNDGLSCSNCIDPIVYLFDSQTYLINALNQFGCRYINEVNINIYPLPNSSIIGSNTVCPGVSDVWYGLNPLDSFLATWWIDTVGIITQNFGDSIYTIWPQAIDSAFIYAYVQYPAGCEGDTITFKVKANRALEPSILVAEDSICYSDREDVIYDLSYNTNGSIYFWEIENGQILSGDSTASIQVSWDSVGTGKLIVREYSTTSIDTCYGEDSVFIEILPNPENDLMLTGKEDVCLDEDVSYEITPGWINSNYDWIAAGSSNISDQGTESIQTSWNSMGDYVVSSQEVSEYGCKGPKDSLEVTVHPIPEPQRVGDDTLLCLDELGNQHYEVSGFVNSAFNWNIEGGMIKSGQGSPSLNVTWDSTIIKSLTVQEISEFGCESETLDIKQYFDLSRLELFVVTVTEDSSISLDFELESLRSYPGDSIWIARRSEFPDLDNWVRVDRIPKVSTDYADQSINPNQSSYGYRVEGKNTCEQEIKSRDHASIFLTGKSTHDAHDVPSEVSARERIELNWTAYRNWDGGVKTYELYEKFDSVYLKVSEANQTELIYDPKIPKKEHCFRIRAVQNGQERESWSNAFCIELERALNIPNVVTPNGDNKNDMLQIENLAAYPEHELTIYNRWGQETFKTNVYNNNWPENSTISGTYFYRLRIEDKVKNISEDYKGWIQVIR